MNANQRFPLEIVEATDSPGLMKKKARTELLPLQTSSTNNRFKYSAITAEGLLDGRTTPSHRILPCLAPLVAVAVVTLCLGVNQNKNNDVQKGLSFQQQVDADQVLFKTTTHPLKPTSIWGSLQPPYPTGVWWINLVLEGNTACAFPQPYGVNFGPNGIVVSNPSLVRSVTPAAIQSACVPDLAVGAVRPYGKVEVERYDALGVTFRFGRGEGGGGAAGEEESWGMRTHLVAGSPFVAVEYDRGQPLITAAGGAILSINGDSVFVPGKVFAGPQLLLALSSGATWGVWAPGLGPALAFEWRDPGTLVAVGPPVTGVVTTAMCVGGAATCAALAPFAGTVVYGAHLDHRVEASAVTLTYRWRARSALGWAAAAAATGEEGEEEEGTAAAAGPLLMLAAPHHMDLLMGKTVPAGLDAAFYSMKGPLTAVVGTEWVLKDKNPPSISWAAPTPLDTESEWGQAVLAQLLLDAQTTLNMQVPDPYGAGKEMGRTARLALLAQEMGRPALALKLAQALGDRLAYWLNEETDRPYPDPLLYDTTWGGVVSTNGLRDAGADFGNAYYNDHHFQYGYFAYGCAVAAKIDPSFIQRLGNKCNFLIADFATHDPENAIFPQARHKDFWAFHSWASGLFSSPVGKNEESSTEAINGYYGVMLYGEATGNKALHDWGKLLLTMEIRAVKKYWHLRDESVYDSVFVATNRMAGNMNSIVVNSQTWFGNARVYVHEIQAMPFTPLTEEVLDCGFVQLQWGVLAPTLGGAEPTWAALARLNQAIIDPEEAWKEFNQIQASDLDNGLTKAAGLHWIATRPPCKQLPEAELLAAARPTVHPACSANSACQALGQQGDCCPTAEGTFLGCCPAGVTYPGYLPPAAVLAGGGDGGEEEEEGEGGACAAAAGCLARGMSGACCPTPEGVYLACCGGAAS